MVSEKAKDITSYCTKQTRSLWENKSRKWTEELSFLLQDTVVGLQAIAEFAQLVDSKDRDISVHVTMDGNNFKKDFSISDENALVLQSAEVSRSTWLVSYMLSFAIRQF